MTGPPAAAGAPSRAAATAYIVFAACCFGAISTLVVIAMRSGVALSAVLASRYLLVAAVMVAVAGSRLSAHRRRGVRLMTVGGVAQVLIAGMSLSSLRWIDAATLGFLFYTYPAWVALLAALRGTEPLDARKLAALGLSLAGIALIVARPGGVDMHPVGLALALASALTYAIYIPLIARVQGDVPATAATAFIGVGAAVLFTLVAALRGEMSFAFSGVGWAAIVVMAVICTALGFVMFLHGLGVLGPVRTAIVSTIEPFFTAVVASFALGQKLTLVTFIGGSLIAAAVVVLQTGSTGAKQMVK